VNHLLIIAHTPLASALRKATLHTYPELADAISAYDVQPQDGRDFCTQCILEELNLPLGELLVCSDVFGASPHFVAQAVVDVRGGVLLTGVNLPMLMRACCYRELPLAQRVQKALEGGQQGIMQIES
jgi:PTS system ascorbate-specific IIA component